MEELFGKRRSNSVNYRAVQSGRNTYKKIISVHVPPAVPRAVDIQQIVPEIYILPPQRRQFAYAQPRVKTDYYAVQISLIAPQALPLYRCLFAGGKTRRVPCDHARFFTLSAAYMAVFPDRRRT